ncbi:MAG: class E sortase [Patescibacteria group bacterium]|mgnify:CR=1 FL=1
MAKEQISVGKHYLAISVAILFFFIFGSILGVFGLLPHDIQQAVQPNPIAINSLFSFSTSTTLSTSPITSVPVEAALVTKEEPAVQYDRGVVKETPLHVSIPKIGVSVVVKNPTSTNVAVLDSALMEGAVRYPTSGLLGESKNVFLMGHSAYSRVIKNRAYHTFDGVEKLVEGDEVYVDSTDARYVYKVVRVSFLKDSEAYIDLESDVRMLTLATCNAFGTKDDRVVVQARFIKKMALPPLD